MIFNQKRNIKIHFLLNHHSCSFPCGIKTCSSESSDLSVQIVLLQSPPTSSMSSSASGAPSILMSAVTSGSAALGTLCSCALRLVSQSPELPTCSSLSSTTSGALEVQSSSTRVLVDLSNCLPPTIP